MLALRTRVLLIAATARVAAEGLALGCVLGAADAGRSPATAGALIATATLPQVVTGPFAGRMLDRARDPRRVLWLAVGTTAGSMTLLGMSGLDPPWSYAGALGMSLATPVLTGGLSSTIGRWSLDSHALSAWDGAGYNVAGLAAPVFVTVAVPLDVTWCFVALGALPCAAGALLIAAPARPDRRSAPRGARPEARIADAARAMLRSPPLRAVTLSTTLFSAAYGGLELALASAVAARGFAVERAGVLATAIACGALAGSVGLARSHRRPEPSLLTIGSIAATGVVLLAGASAGWTALLVAMVVVGVLDAPILVGTYRARHLYGPADLRGSVFTLGSSAKLAASSIGAIAIGGAIGTRDTSWGLAAIGATALLAGAVGIVSAPRDADRAAGVTE